MNERLSASERQDAPHTGTVGEMAVTSSSNFDLLFDATPTPILVLDRASLRFRAVNDAALRFYGYTRSEFLDLRLPDIRPEKIPGEIEAMIAKFDDPALPEVPRLHLTKSGEQRIVKVNARMFDFEGAPAILAAVFDMTAQQEMERELRRVRSFLKNLVDHIPAAIFAKDAATGEYVFYNRAAEGLFGSTQQEVIGRTAPELYGADLAKEYIAQDAEARKAGPSGVVSDYTLVDSEGNTRIVSIRKVVITNGTVQDKQYILGVAEDVTEARLREAQIAHLASHDALTGLANRWMFQQRLEATASLPDAARTLVAIHYIDLDGFKEANDAWGHSMGDEILKIAASRMRSIVKENDVVARLGGDEFAILQLSPATPRDAKAMAKEIVDILSAPYFIEEIRCEIGASVGVCVARLDVPVEHVIEEADRALYVAKREGKRRFVCHSTLQQGHGAGADPHQPVPYKMMGALKPMGRLQPDKKIV